MGNCLEIIKDFATIVFSIVGSIVAICGLTNYLKEIRGKYQFDLALRLGKAINSFTSNLILARTELVKLVSYSKNTDFPEYETVEYIKGRIDKRVEEFINNLSQSYSLLSALEIEAKVIWRNKKIIDIFEQYCNVYLSFMSGYNLFIYKWHFPDEKKRTYQITSEQLFKNKYLLNIFYLPPGYIVYESKAKFIIIDNKIEKDLKKYNESAFGFLKKYF